MKKRFSLLITILFTLCLVLAGCASKRTASVVGTWKIVSANEKSSGLELEGEQLEEFGLNDITFEFKDNGHVTVKMSADSSEEGIYSVEDNTVTITEGITDITGEINDTSMTINESDITIVLV
jgi:hypothetical protein